MLVCAAGNAAEPQADPRSLSQWVLSAQERLALAPGQQRELRALMEESSSRMTTLQSRRVRREEVAVLHREFREGLVAILKPEQVAEWDALVEELLREVHLRNAPILAGRLH